MKDQAERLRELTLHGSRRSGKSSSKIIAVSSGKGGTGKTFLSLNLSYELARQNQRVLLIDLDFNMSNVELMMDYQTDKTIYDFFTGHELLTGVISEVESNLHFIFGYSGMNDYTDPTSSQIEYLFTALERVKDKYDVIIIDTGAGMSPLNTTILRCVGHNLIVTTPEPTAIMDAYVLIKNLSKSCGITSFQVIINKVPIDDNSANGFDKLSAAVTHFLNSQVKLLGQINYDNNSYKSIIDQKVFVLEHPTSSTRHQISHIATGLLNYIQMANNSQHELSRIS